VQRRIEAACSRTRGLTPPSSGRPKGRFAPFGPTLMSNVRPHMNSRSPRTTLLLGVASCSLLLVGSCALSDHAVVEGRPEYRGSTLLVGGVEYLVDTKAEEHQAGTVLVFPKGGEVGSVQHTLVRLGLRATLNGSEPGWFLVSVPTGFETQWLGALRNLPGVASAYLDVKGRLL